MWTVRTKLWDLKSKNFSSPKIITFSQCRVRVRYFTDMYGLSFLGGHMKKLGGYMHPCTLDQESATYGTWRDNHRSEHLVFRIYMLAQVIIAQFISICSSKLDKAGCVNMRIDFFKMYIPMQI